MYYMVPRMVFEDLLVGAALVEQHGRRMARHVCRRGLRECLSTSRSLDGQRHTVYFCGMCTYDYYHYYYLADLPHRALFHHHHHPHHHHDHHQSLLFIRTGHRVRGLVVLHPTLLFRRLLQQNRLGRQPGTIARFCGALDGCLLQHKHGYCTCVAVVARVHHDDNTS